MNRKIFNDKLSAYILLKFFTEGSDREGGPAELHPVGPGADRMLAIAEPIPVEERPKPLSVSPQRTFPSGVYSVSGRVVL